MSDDNAVLEALLRIEMQLGKILQVLSTRVQAKPVVAAAPPVSEIADDSDLDSQYGDPEIKKDPPRWKGEPIAPRKMSQGTPEWLDEVARFKAWQAEKADENGETTSAGKPKSHYFHLDSARAKGWAKRLRSGWPQQSFGDDDVRF